MTSDIRNKQVIDVRQKAERERERDFQKVSQRYFSGQDTLYQNKQQVADNRRYAQRKMIDF